MVNRYAFAEDKREMVKNAFYDKLDRIYEVLPSRKSKIIIGDLNVLIEKETVYRPTIGITVCTLNLIKMEIN